MKHIKNIVLTMVLVPFLFSCTMNKDDRSNIVLVERYVQAVQDVDISAMESMLDDEYLGLGPSMNDTIGKQMVLANWEDLGNNIYESVVYKTSRYANLDVSAGGNEGEWVSNWAELTVVFKADHQSVTIWANSVYQIKNNKIVKSYTFYNEADALEQLGYVYTYSGIK